jgi:hypothetical protein
MNVHLFVKVNSKVFFYKVLANALGVQSISSEQLQNLRENMKI